MKTVYAHFDNQASLILIGEGKNNRPTDRRSRPQSWYTSVSNGYYAVPLITVSTETEALRIEGLLINYAKTNNYNICNTNNRVMEDFATANELSALTELVHYLHFPTEVFKNHKLLSGKGGSYAKHKFIGTCLVTGKVIECSGAVGVAELGFNYGHVHRAANGYETSHKGYTWTQIKL